MWTGAAGGDCTALPTVLYLAHGWKVFYTWQGALRKIYAVLGDGRQKYGTKNRTIYKISAYLIVFLYQI